MRDVTRARHIRYSDPQEHRCLPANRSFIVRQINAVGAADAEDSCADGLENVGDSRALANLHQIPGRRDDFAAGGQGTGHQQHASGVGSRYRCSLGIRQRTQQPGARFHPGKRFRCAGRASTSRSDETLSRLKM